MTAPGATGALVVHRRDFLLAPGFIVIFEDDDLRILPAQLNDRVHFGMHLLHRQRNSRHFLHKLRADLLSNAAATGAGHEDARVPAVDADLVLHALQEFERLFRLLGFVPLVVLPEDLVGRGVDHRRFHRRRADVEPDQELRVMVVRLLIRRRGNLK